MSEDNLLLIQKSNKGADILMNFLYIWVNDVLMKFICCANQFLFFFRVGTRYLKPTRYSFLFLFAGVASLHTWTPNKNKGDEQEKKHDEQPFNVGDVSFSEWNQWEPLNPSRSQVKSTSVTYFGLCFDDPGTPRFFCNNSTWRVLEPLSGFLPVRSSCNDYIR